ncbi:MAG: LruC domain-containing protein [Prevotella sp.]|nr:LruC domain-containing protein [Prevotella sp.]
MTRKYLHFALAALAIGATQACKEDYFDPDAYNELVVKAFPVQNVDPQQTWATMRTVTTDVTVTGGFDTSYKVGIYLENPLTTDSLTTLYTARVADGDHLLAQFSCPTSYSHAYIGVFDSKGRRLVRRVSIENDRIDALVGGTPTAGARQKAQESDYQGTYAKTASDFLNLSSEMVEQAKGYFNSANQGWLASSITTPATVTLGEMQAYTLITDDVIVNQTSNGNHNLSDPIAWDNSGQATEWGGHGDGKHYRVAAGTEITEVFHINSQFGKWNDAVVYIEGTVHLKGNTLNGPTLVVASGGKIVIDDKTDMSNAGRIVVLAGGRIEGTQGKTFNVNNGGPCYNAGTIDFDGELNINGSIFYNCGTVNVDVLRNTSGGLITNFGHITARANMGASDAYNCTFVNGCYMHYTEQAGIGHLTMLKNSRLDVDGLCEFNQSWNESFDAATPDKALAYVPANPNILMDKSVVNIETGYFTNTVFQGPSQSGEFAIVKMQKAQVANGTDLMQRQNCYFDWDITELYSKWNDHPKYQDISAEQKQWNPYGYLVDYYREHILNFSSSENSMFYIPAAESDDDCTGAGYGPEPDGEEIIPTPVEQPMGYRFCFEDNFPEPGDYDFNDVVLTVTPVVSGTTVTLTVSLDAVGATKSVAAAVRIAGLSSSDVVSCTRNNDLDQNFPTVVPKIINTTEALLPDNMKNGTTDVVINFFSNAHWAMKPEYASDGSVRNFFYNTKSADYRSERDVPAKSVTYTFELRSEQAANKFTQENMDAFIVEDYNGAYWEVHTVPFKSVQVLSEYASNDKFQYRQFSNNMPWAICVPNTPVFKYPVEFQSIGNKAGNVLSGAYQTLRHAFGEWAQNHNVSTDWYNYPTPGLVYE